MPKVETLRRYGMTQAEWIAMVRRQGGGCAICGNVPASGTLHVDHQHVRGWKRMPPEERRRYVRGVICWACNSLLRVRVTVAWLRGATKYLLAYEKRLTSTRTK